jgi:hypothetical protein
LIAGARISRGQRVDAPLARIRHRHHTIEILQRLVVSVAGHAAPAKVVQRHRLVVSITVLLGDGQNAIQQLLALAPFAQPQERLAVEAIDLERDVRIALRQLTRRNKRLATGLGVPLFDLRTRPATVDVRGVR